MKRLLHVVLALATIQAIADPSGPVHVKKGEEPPWFSVTATVEQNRATYFIRIRKDKGIDLGKHRFPLRFQVPEYGYPLYLIPVAMEQDNHGLSAAFTVPADVARKGSLFLGVESREAKNGASYVISMSNYVAAALPPVGGDGKPASQP